MTWSNEQSIYVSLVHPHWYRCCTAPDKTLVVINRFNLYIKVSFNKVIITISFHIFTVPCKHLKKAFCFATDGCKVVTYLLYVLFKISKCSCMYEVFLSFKVTNKT